jgi:hypothetical protein
MATGQTQLQDWLMLVRAEFDELPDLELTRPQVEELWDLEATVAEALLSALVSAGFLRRTRQGADTRCDIR